MAGAAGLLYESTHTVLCMYLDIRAGKGQCIKNISDMNLNGYRAAEMSQRESDDIMVEQS